MPDNIIWFRLSNPNKLTLFGFRSLNSNDVNRFDFHDSNDEFDDGDDEDDDDVRMNKVRYVAILAMYDLVKAPLVAKEVV
ncbi:hypothetical protein CsSME_00053345 [Camellia sinensis var. sinensis]